MAKNVAEQLVDILERAGVKRIYAVAGDSLNHLNIAVKNSKQIEWIHVRHEEAGAYAAAAEAELEGLSVCAGSSGPGHVHLLNGMYDAHNSHVPMLVIASTLPTTKMGRSNFQETNTIKLFDDCSYYNQVITRVEQVDRIAHTALQHALARKGVAVIGIPGDVFEMDADSGALERQVFETKPLLRPSEDEMAKLATLVNEATKVTVFCGIGASEANREVVQLAETLKAPVGYSFRAKMSIQPNNPYEIGMTGLLGQAAAYHAMHDAELLLLLGTDFPYDDFIPEENTIVQIDEKAEYLGRRANLKLGLCGDIKETLRALLPLLRQKQDTTFLDDQLKIYDKVKETNRTYIKDSGEHEKIQPEYFTRKIDELAAENAIFTLDTGMTCIWGARFIRGTGSRKMLGSFNHGSMANAMPMAIGAALSRPDQQIFALCGDGGLSMLLGDLATIKQYNLPIKVIVYNNRSLGMVKLEMEVAGMVHNETDMVNPDFSLIAQAMGFPGRNVYEPDEVEEAIREAIAHPGPFLLNVFTNPNALAMPPKIEIGQMLGMTKAMSKLMLGGRSGEVVDTVKSNYKHLKELL